MHVQELLDRYRSGPARLREALTGLTEEELRFKYDPAKWSAAEIVIHVADMDHAASFRMKRIIAEPDARYPGVDQDLWAVGLGYQGRKAEPSLRLLEAVRAEMADILGALPAEAWGRKGLHDQAGDQTLSSVVEKFTGHLEGHVDQIQAIRPRLGK